MLFDSIIYTHKKIDNREKLHYENRRDGKREKEERE